MVFDICGEMKLDEINENDLTVRVRLARKLIKQYIEGLKSLMKNGIYLEILLEDSIRINQDTQELYILDFPFGLDGPEIRVGSGLFSYYSSSETILRTPFLPENAMVWSIGVLLYKLIYNRYPFSSNLAHNKATAR